MKSIESIMEDICYLQVKIPEELYKVKKDLEEYKIYDDERSNNRYVKSLAKKNKKLKKKNSKLEKKIKKMEEWISGLLHIQKQSGSTTSIVNANNTSDNIVDLSEVRIKDEPRYNNTEVIVIDYVDKHEDFVSDITPGVIERCVEEEVEEEEVEEVEVVEEEEEVEVVEEEEVEEGEVEVVEEEEVEEEVEVVEEEEVEEEVEVVEEEEVEEEVEVVEEEEVEEEVEVVEEEEVEEEVEVVEEEEVEEEVEVVEEEEVEEEVEVIEEEEEPEDEVYEVTIKGKPYYVTNEIDSVIYDTDENGDVSLEVGKYNKGKPVFYKKYNK